LFQRKNTAELTRTVQQHATQLLPIVLVLENVRSMHNVGSVFRTCDALGLEALYLIGYTPTPPHRDIQKTALGATETVRWQHFESIEPALETLRQEGYQILAAEQAHGATWLHQFEPTTGERLAIVFGNEVTGVSDAVLTVADQCLEIPQVGSKHSFNISVSAGIIGWELARKLRS
jgi:tRNA G18 (ribose-2'-O)-methylase SpoU